MLIQETKAYLAEAVAYIDRLIENLQEDVGYQAALPITVPLETGRRRIADLAEGKNG